MILLLERMTTAMDLERFVFDGSRRFEPKKFDSAYICDYGSKEEASQKMLANLKRLTELQDRLYAENKEALLIIFQAMDAAGKDGTIKHVMSGMNPQGIDVWNFKQPSAEELDHDYLWRCMKRLPERGKICIFNRSYYEDVLVGRVHELYKNQNLPQRCLYDNIIKRRCRQIRDFEKYLWENGIRVVKFFLDVSKEEQKKRFLSRIDNPAKNWKFSEADIRERAHWDEYQKAYRDAINATATPEAPWIVVPADKKWFTRLVVSQFLVKTLETIDPQYPVLPAGTQKMLGECRAKLTGENPAAPNEKNANTSAESPSEKIAAESSGVPVNPHADKN